jgi:hypothetical protein
LISELDEYFFWGGWGAIITIIIIVAFSFLLNTSERRQKVIDFGHYFLKFSGLGTGDLTTITSMTIFFEVKSLGFSFQRKHNFEIFCKCG